MFMRISSFALTLLLIGCSESEKSNGPAPLVPQGGATVEAPAEPPKTICAVDGAAELAPVCDRELVDGLLTLRHPSGGFRRLQIMTDGRGVIAADGAELASVTTIGTSLIEVSIGGDRYRLPAVVQR
jgi:ABC-type Fe3+-hydroxamate transport system substrate-binding protein